MALLIYNWDAHWMGIEIDVPNFDYARAHVGAAMIEAVDAGSGRVALIDEEGLSSGKQINRVASAILNRNIAGKMLLLDKDEAARILEL